MIRFLKKIKKKITNFRLMIVSYCSPSIVASKLNNKNLKKWALVSYLKDSANMSDSDPRIKWNSNWWECRELVKILHELGYNVELIASNDEKTTPSRQYDLIIDLARNLYRLAPLQKETCKKILLCTGSHHKWAIEQEQKRIDYFNEKHGVSYNPRYTSFPLEKLNKSLSVADSVLLIGNDVTLNTYPDEFKKKITKIHVTASEINFVKEYKNQKNNRFLYFSSPRNVGKGLDIVLDFILEHPDYSLAVVGNVESEKDFMEAYPNIHKNERIVFYGHMAPSSKEFMQIVDECDAFILPSISEGTSTSALTCIMCGLYPILSYNSGVTLPEGCGIWLNDCSSESLDDAVNKFSNKSLNCIKNESLKAKTFVSALHNRDNYRSDVFKCFVDLLKSEGCHE